VTDIDLDLVRRAQDGDQAACRALVEGLHRPVLATIHRFLGSRFRHEVEDIAQEVFLKIFRSLHRFEPDRGVKFTTWTYTFVRNHCFDTLKKRRVPTWSLTSKDDDAQIEVSDPATPGPEAALASQELGSKIEAALQSLNEHQRLVFILREYQGLDYAAIAAALDVSEGTVKSRLHRAKEAMRQHLEPFLRAGA
jgi:RNA polymerase sigma-70 factor (ECF subfamily)